MAIHTTANKYKESGKDGWMTSQTKPVGGNRSVIETTANKAHMSSDSITKNVFSGHFSGGNVIKDAASHKESHPINKAA